MSYIKRLMEEICTLLSFGHTKDEIAEMLEIPITTVNCALYYYPTMYEES